MKTEINHENKKRFLLQYAGMPYKYKNEFGTYTNDILKEPYNFKTHVETAWLELKPLSSITDEDAIEVAKSGFSFFDCSGFDIKVIRELSKVSVAAISRDTCLVKIEVTNAFKLNIYEIDYLRSKGYALPWLNLSVQDLVDCKWIKIKEI